MAPDLRESAFTYTRAMNDGEAERRLREAEIGTLALANDREAYAIPVAFHHENDRVYFRLGLHPGSTKMRFLDATARASLLVYETGPSDSAWSIVISGPIERLEDGDERFDDATINALFAPLRVFDEPIEAIDPTVFALAIETVHGRTTG